MDGAYQATIGEKKPTQASTVERDNQVENFPDRRSPEGEPQTGGSRTNNKKVRKGHSRVSFEFPSTEPQEEQADQIEQQELQKQAFQQKAKKKRKKVNKNGKRDETEDSRKSIAEASYNKDVRVIPPDHEQCHQESTQNYCMDFDDVAKEGIELEDTCHQSIEDKTDANAATNTDSIEQNATDKDDRNIAIVTSKTEANESEISVADGDTLREEALVEKNEDAKDEEESVEKNKETKDDKEASDEKYEDTEDQDTKEPEINDEARDKMVSMTDDSLTEGEIGVQMQEPDDLKWTAPEESQMAGMGSSDQGSETEPVDLERDAEVDTKNCNDEPEISSQTITEKDDDKNLDSVPDDEDQSKQPSSPTQRVESEPNVNESATEPPNKLKALAIARSSRSAKYEALKQRLENPIDDEVTVDDEAMPDWMIADSKSARRREGNSSGNFSQLEDPLNRQQDQYQKNQDTLTHNKYQSQLSSPTTTTNSSDNHKILEGKESLVIVENAQDLIGPGSNRFGSCCCCIRHYFNRSTVCPSDSGSG